MNRPFRGRRLRLASVYPCLTIAKMNRITDEMMLCSHNAVAIFCSQRPLHVRYARDELICQSGSYAAGLYLIQYGLVDESTQDPRVPSDVVQHNLLSGNDLIGLEILLEPKEDLYQTSCRALTDTELLFVERATFAEALAQDYDLNRYVLAALAARHFALQRSTWRQSAPPRERLCSLLLDVVASVGRRNERDDGTYLLPAAINQRMLSQLANLSLRQLRSTYDTLDGVRMDRNETLLISPERLLAERAADSML